MPHRHFLAGDVERTTVDVAGWLGLHEGRLLYRLATVADPAGCIVEIGSWQGKSTIWLAAGAKAGRGARVVAIDPHTGTELREPGETTEDLLRANLERAGSTTRWRSSSTPPSVSPRAGPARFPALDRR